MHIIMRLLTAFIALGVWVPLIVAEDDDLSVVKAHGLTTKMAQALLDAHNELRAKEPASDMIRMEWNPDIAQTAQEWANNCKFDHSYGGQRKNHVSGYAYLGENLHATSGKFIPAPPVHGWYSEKSRFNYDSNKCMTPNKACGHYTQVVWANSESLGCGAKYCPNMGNFLVCQYGPGGNYNGAIPYKSGGKCSKCPKKHSHCVKGMCYHSPEDKTEISRVFSGGSLIRASYVTPLLLSCVALAQIMHY